MLEQVPSKHMVSSKLNQLHSNSAEIRLTKAESTLTTTYTGLVGSRSGGSALAVCWVLAAIPRVGIVAKSSSSRCRGSTPGNTSTIVDADSVAIALDRIVAFGVDGQCQGRLPGDTLIPSASTSSAFLIAVARGSGSTANTRVGTAAKSRAAMIRAGTRTVRVGSSTAHLKPSAQAMG